MVEDAQLNVLVIDDDEKLRQLLVDIITREGHQAVPAGSAEEGLELLPIWTFQVAFIDQRLPGMEGLVLGEYLRSNNPDMMIALVTGEPDKKLKRKSKDLSIVHIAKPFDIKEIVAVLGDYGTTAKTRLAARLRHEDPDYAAPIGRYADELTDYYGIPNVPARVEERLSSAIKRSLNELRSVSRYTERERVVALAGLLAAQVLGVQLPKAGGTEQRTLYEEYDALMREHGRRVEFEWDGVPSTRSRRS